MSACRSCGAPVRWVITSRGKRMPLDAEPVDDGNVVLDMSDRNDPVAIVVPPEQILVEDGPRYVSHFATCPNADQHRRR